MEGNGSSHLIPHLERHGEQLDTMEQVLLDGFTRVTAAIEKLEGSLLAAATGKDHMPLVAVKWMNRAYLSLIIGLLFSLVFILTGQQLNWFPRP